MITGLSSSSKNRDIDKAFEYFNDPTSNKEIYSIVIMHEADSIDEVISKYKVNLALAGGNLNGQIRFPGIGGLLTRENASKYLNEYYKISNTNLYISSGVGTDNSQIRMFNRPSINFFRLATNYSDLCTIFIIFNLIQFNNSLYFRFFFFHKWILK